MTNSEMLIILVYWTINAIFDICFASVYWIGMPEFWQLIIFPVMFVSSTELLSLVVNSNQTLFARSGNLGVTRTIH